MDETLPDKSNGVDFEQSFSNLTQLAVVILYHSSQKLELPDDSVFPLLSVNVLWCTLLTCKEGLKGSIAFPIEKIITSQASKRKMLVEYPGITKKVSNQEAAKVPNEWLLLETPNLIVSVKNSSD